MQHRGAIVKKFITGSMAIGLLFAAASCGSDAKTTSTTTAATAISTADSAATGASTVDTTAISADVSGLDAVHAQAFTLGIESAAAGGVTLDAACYKAIVAQLSAADAQLIVDAGPAGNPTLSAAGEALGAQVLSTCVPATATT